jgi:hypothetical protein
MAKPLYVWDGSAWQQINTPSAVVFGTPSRTTVTVTTASLANNATENNTVTMELGYRVLSVTVDRACRIRLYTNTTKRTADAGRAVGTDPTGDHGLMLELVFTAAGTLTMSPLVDGFVDSGTAIPYAITNTSGATSTVQVQLTYLRTQ